MNAIERVTEINSVTPEPDVVKAACAELCAMFGLTERSST